MSALDIKLAINQALANVPGSREETITINSNVHFFNLTCSGGMMLEEKDLDTPRSHQIFLMKVL